MKRAKTKQILIAILYVLITIATIEGIIACSIQDQLNLHKQYYIATEALLDSLEEQFNWIDRYDGPVLEDYYYYRSKLNK